MLKPREIAQLDDFRLLRIDLLEPVQRIVQRRQDVRLVVGDRNRIGQRDAAEAGPALLGAAGARALDEDLPHRPRGDADEMALVVPRRAGAGQPEVGLVDERRRLEGLARPLPPHVGPGDPAQLVVNERRDLLGRLAVLSGRKS